MADIFHLTHPPMSVPVEQSLKELTLQEPETQTLVITSDHAWHHGVTLRLHLGKTSSSTVSLHDSHADKVHEGLVKTPAQAVAQAAVLFHWFGLGPDELKVTSGTMQQAYNFVYALPIPDYEKLKAVHIATCGCNMGHCDCVTGLEEVQGELRTYGDLMQTWGYPVVVKSPSPHSGLVYFEYPDCVMLEASVVTEKWLPVVYDSCYTKNVVKPAIALKPELQYMMYSYGR